jgi:hypothetical protein
MIPYGTFAYSFTHFLHWHNASARFDEKGNLLNIHELKPWSLQQVLQEKYGFEPALANEFGSFLLPMLDVRTSHRALASVCLAHPWLNPSAEELAAIQTVEAFNLGVGQIL